MGTGLKPAPTAHQEVQPPSMTGFVPVAKLAASEAR
ncbi:hypothetical protein BH18ACT11_BH18ACT11_01020 [soil metagenome]